MARGRIKASLCGDAFSVHEQTKMAPVKVNKS